MSDSTPKVAIPVRTGVVIHGRAVGDSQFRSGVGKGGTTWSSVETQVLAGTLFVRVTERGELGKVPPLHKDGDPVTFSAKGNYKTNNVLVIDAVSDVESAIRK